MPDPLLKKEIARRRTFAIISHPDAGKTTLTEKLLLYAGTLREAGSVKARKAERHAVSDWMQMEQERGISITSTVLQFDYRDHRLNLVDTPGHADFSEDTYRALAAVDSAIMLMDGIKGVEERTRRLFEVCMMRRLPVVTFVNKLDRVARDPLELMDEVASVFGIAVTALNWPIGEAGEFRGVVDRRTGLAHLYTHADHGARRVPVTRLPFDSPELRREIGENLHDTTRESLDLLAAGDPWDETRFLQGRLTPFFFGSAMTNFGVEPVIDALVELAPPPGPRAAGEEVRAPDDRSFSGFIFKIQANMNPRHRDRIAFLRVVSGRFQRGMDAVSMATGETLRLSKPHTLLGTERSLLDEAVPGDIVGLYDPGVLRIGDTLVSGEPVTYEGIPRFAPEHFARIRAKDPSRKKHLQKGLAQLSQEGAVQLFFGREQGRADPFMGVVGLLQFEVLQARLEQEYGTSVVLEHLPYTLARWVGGDAAGLAGIHRTADLQVVQDRDDRPVVIATTPWHLRRVAEALPKAKLLDVSPLL